MLNDLFKATLETLKMTFVSLGISYCIAIPIAFGCVETNKEGLFPCRIVHRILDIIIALGRAVPFILLMVLCLPLTRLLIGTGIGTNAVIVPLVIATVPFAARIIETSLLEVDRWIIVAAQVDNAPKWKILIKIKFLCVLPQIIEGLGNVGIAVLGYTTMAGTVGGGGLGNYAIVYGFQRYNWVAALFATIIIVIIAFIIQTACQISSRKIKGESKI